MKLDPKYYLIRFFLWTNNEECDHFLGEIHTHDGALIPQIGSEILLDYLKDFQQIIEENPFIDYDSFKVKQIHMGYGKEVFVDVFMEGKYNVENI